MDYTNLILSAKQAATRAYAPYSHYCVGAALLTDEGQIFQGCNIENSAFTPCNCAERLAIFKAVYEGYRNFDAIAVCGYNNGRLDDECTPCGVCRQVFSEFCKNNFKIICIRNSGYDIFSLDQLLPYMFGKNLHNN